MLHYEHYISHKPGEASCAEAISPPFLQGVDGDRRPPGSSKKDRRKRGRHDKQQEEDEDEEDKRRRRYRRREENSDSDRVRHISATALQVRLSNLLSAWVY